MSGNRTIFDDLDMNRFVPLRLKKAENYRLVYVNYNLAIQLGYSLDKLNDTLQNTYGLVVDDQKDSNSEIYGFADTYNASPFKPARESGSGRGVFLKNGLFLKGVGLTQLAPLRGMSIKTLNTGFCPLYEGIKEAVYGEFFHQQGPVPSTRVLAIFDLGFKDDDKKNYTGILDQGLIVRVGDHARIAHYTDGTALKEFEVNVGKHRPSDDWHKYKPSFSFSEIIKNHAKTLADAEFKRFWHGAMDDGNTTMRGGLIDFGSATFQLDTAPRYWLDPKDFFWFAKESKESLAKIGTFGYEYLGVADNLKLLYPEFNPQEFHNELKHQKFLKLLEMFGFLEMESEEFLANPECAALISDFYASWWQLGKYFYWGDMNGRTSVAEPLSLIDIFTYLRNATSAFCEMQPLPEIEIRTAMHVKKSNPEFWQEKDSGWAAPYIPYGVRLDAQNQMLFFSTKEQNEFYQEKTLLNSKLSAVLAAFISYWQIKGENITAKKQLLKNSVARHSMPLTDLSRGPLLTSFKKAFAKYQQGQLNALQEFIDQTVALNIHEKDKNDAIQQEKSAYFNTNSSPLFFQRSNGKESDRHVNLKIPDSSRGLNEKTTRLAQ